MEDVQSFLLFSSHSTLRIITESHLYLGDDRTQCKQTLVDVRTFLSKGQRQCQQQNHVLFCAAHCPILPFLILPNLSMSMHGYTMKQGYGTKAETRTFFASVSPI